MRVREILERAIDAIRVQGWSDGGLVTTDGRVCLLGGILLAQGYTVAEIRDSIATYDDLNKDAVKLVAERVIARELGNYCCDDCAADVRSGPEYEICYGFNDYNGSEELVIDVLKDAVGHAPID